jgi:hypothetical protein
MEGKILISIIISCFSILLIILLSIFISSEKKDFTEDVEELRKKIKILEQKVSEINEPAIVTDGVKTVMGRTVIDTVEDNPLWSTGNGSNDLNAQAILGAARRGSFVLGGTVPDDETKFRLYWKGDRKIYKGTINGQSF